MVETFCFGLIIEFFLPSIQLIQDQVRDSLNLNLKVCDVILDKTWIKGLILQLVPSDVADKILAIPLPLNDMDDDFIWEPFPNGTFSVKSAT